MYLDKATTSSEAVLQAIGAASMCWDQVPQGVFDSERAKAIGEELMEWVDQSRLGFATTKELINELAARAAVAEAQPGESWPNYRTVDSD